VNIPFDTAAIDALIVELLDRHAAEKSSPPMHFRERMLAMGSEGGRLVESVVRMARPATGLEIGTSSGFSALCALRGALAAGADLHLTTVDFDPAKAAWARSNFERAGVAGRVTILVEDGLEAARRLTGPFDYVLLDASKEQCLPILKELTGKLTPGAVVLTDNMLTHEAELREFARFVRNYPEFASALLPLGNGVELTIKLAPRVSDRIVPGDALERLRQG